MIYQAYQAQADMLAPMRFLAHATEDVLTRGWPLGNNLFTRSWAASCEMIARAGMSHDRRPFNIDSVDVAGVPVAITEEEIVRTPFCSLLHFKKASDIAQPKLLLVAPLSGHFATLLRGTAQTLLRDHDVYITDWFNIRSVPLSAGTFDFDDFVDHVIDFLHLLGPSAHVMAVCQPSVPVLAAVSLMAASNDPFQPATMTLMGGPIDPRRNPTQVNQLATAHPIEWFETNVIGIVPMRYPGAFRRVYPGFMQLAGFVSMNLDRHVNAHVDLFNNLVKGDGEHADVTRKFYDEYVSVMDLSADFYLQTIQQVFQEYRLPLGTLESRGRKVEPAAITRTALLTIEGERDDICAVGQTAAAQDLVSSLPDAKRHHHLQMGVGHYGVFNGKRWSNEIYPVVRDFVLMHHDRAVM
jgi:poly(3-hydroxybutyrate) depolymerase